MSFKILLIDDEIEIIKLVEKFLKIKGFQVVTASNGEEGLAILAEDPAIDLVVLDHRMPGLDGTGVLREIKKRGKKSPVILLTGSIGKNTRELKDIDGFLMKPIDLNELVAKINELVDKRG